MSDANTMSSDGSNDARSAKAKKVVSAAPFTTPANASPTTFFLKTEKEMEMSVQRGRKTSRSNDEVEHSPQRTSVSRSMADSSFGVQSLEDTINTAFSSDSDLSRTSSNNTDAHSGEADTPSGRKRRIGNPVHPKIRSTGQRILSSERPAKPSSTAASPISGRSAESPFRNQSLRKHSNSPSGRQSQPLTPVRLSPHPLFASPSTPRSSSPKSFRLSDEEASLADDTNSQAVASSNGEDEDVERTPQLVMPSLAMPTRRPFTEHGKAMSRLKLMIVGPQGVGKTSFIQSVLRSCEHIVHVDPVPIRTTSHASPQETGKTTTKFIEISASTKSCPTWWSDLDSKKAANRRLSMGDVLERNLMFIDTPPIEDDSQVQKVLEYMENQLRRTSDMERLSDSEVIGMLSGDGGAQIDAVVYLFRPDLATSHDPLSNGISATHQKLLQNICKWTNLIPLVGCADRLTPETLNARKEQILQLMASMGLESYKLNGALAEPFAVSSAAGDDTDIIDASLLMSSQYMQPLAPSELDTAIHHLFSHLSMARLRRLSASKFLAWRRDDPASQLLHQQHDGAHTPHTGFHSLDVTSVSSLLGDPSKVLVPCGTSSYYRSASPSISEASALPDSTCALTHYHGHVDINAPIREVITAKWAQDLTRSREKETRRYVEMFNYPLSDCEANTADNPEKALVHAARESQRPARGRLGGDLGVIDPSDPLGVLAFSHGLGRRGYLVLQVAGGCGLLGAVCYCVVRYWINVQEICGFGPPNQIITANAIPAPARSSLYGWDSQLRGFFGWGR